MKPLGTIACWAKVHKRGRRISGPIGAIVNDKIVSVRMVDFFQCPRCHATWTRKIKPQSPAKQTREGGAE